MSSYEEIERQKAVIKNLSKEVIRHCENKETCNNIYTKCYNLTGTSNNHIDFQSCKSECIYDMPAIFYILPLAALSASQMNYTGQWPK